jgi:hypothetical protein
MIAAATGLNFILRMGWVGERHISTPWGDPDGLRRANVEECGHGRDPHLLVALIGIQSVRQFMA